MVSVGGGASGLLPSRRMFVLGGEGGGVMILESFLVRFFAPVTGCILLPNLRSNDSRDRYVNIAQDRAAASPAVGLASSV